MSLKHTWSMPLLLLLILLAAYYISPGEHNPLYPALHLSYANPALHERTNTLPAHIGNPTQYGKGKKDFAFVAFYTIVFTFTREFCMQRLILPLAIRAGIKSRGKQARFMEQAYTAMYFAVFGPFGLWVMSRTPVWYFNTTGILGAAGYCVDATAGEAAEGLQGAGLASHHHACTHWAELQVPFHLYGYCCVHHA